MFSTFTCSPPDPHPPAFLSTPTLHFRPPPPALANVATVQTTPPPFPAAPLIAFITVSMGAAARSNLLIMCCISGGPGAGMEHRGMPGSARPQALLRFRSAFAGTPHSSLAHLMEAGPVGSPHNHHYQHQPVASSCDCRLEPFTSGSTCFKILLTKYCQSQWLSFLIFMYFFLIG